jgi:4-hydroxy-tetrahydrodipicolinate synthase
MVSKTDWAGIYPAVTTQFKQDGALDLEATQREIDALVKAGVHGLIMLGTVGENCSLLGDEKRKVLSATREAVKGRVPILSGVAEYTTALGSQFAKDAEAIGIDGLMVLPGMVYKADAREALAHFRTVARSTGLPIMIYNNPIVYGVDVKPEGFVDLAAEKNIVAIKESCDDPRRITDLRNVVGDRYILFCGVDDLVLESVALGIEGWVSGLTDVFPDESLALWNAALAGRLDEARAIYRWFTPTLHLDTHMKLVQYIKLGQQVTGLGSEWVRAPRLPLEGEERKRILALYETAVANRPKLKKAAE